jgi:hypothetical protein
MYIDWYFINVNELDVQLSVHLKPPLIRLDRNWDYILSKFLNL